MKEPDTPTKAYKPDDTIPAVDFSPAVDDMPARDQELSVHDPLLGTTFSGRYEILTVLGRGGMSVVYLARHLIMKKIVALKVMHGHLSNDENAVKRFRQEARAVSHFSHPHIIAVHDFGAAESGQPFLVMDYIQGKSLSAVLEGSKLEPQRAVGIFIQAASALQEAHKNGVIHRDLKPSNIMLVDNEKGEDFVKIVDFGIAKLLPQEGEEYKKLTQTGETFGSPLYMSPEQCLAQPLDARSDIYAIGCVMYEVLSGKPPLSGGNIYETIYKQINDLPPGLESAIPDKNIREPLEAIVFKCLAKDRNQRYQTMAALQNDLEVLSRSSSRSIFARMSNAWSLARLKHAPEKKSLGVRAASMLVVLALLLGAGSYTGWLWWNAYLDSTVSSYVQDESLWRPIEVNEHPFVDATAEDFAKDKQLAEAGVVFAKRLSDQEKYYGALMDAGRLYFLHRSFDEAGEHYKKALAEAKGFPGRFRRPQFAACSAAADANLYGKRWAAADEYLSEASDHLRSIVDDPLTLSLLDTKRADCAYFQKNLSDAGARLDDAILRLSAPSKAKSDKPFLYKQFLARCYEKRGDVFRRLADKAANRQELLQKARSSFVQAVTLWKELKGPASEEACICLAYMGLIDAEMQDFAASQKDYEEAITMLRNNPDMTEGHKAIVLGGYSTVLFRQLHIAEGIAAMQEAANIREKSAVGKNQ
jgi:serine/threonine protein kinase